MLVGGRAVMNAADADKMLAQLQRGRSKHAREGTDELDDLDLRLIETVSWCIRHSVLGRVRRPPPLPANRWDAVDSVVLARRAEFDRTRDVTLDRVPGQLLVYFPDADLVDGAAEAASKDFFDVHNAPPCGTWIGYFDEGGTDPSYSSYLLAWVPQVFMDLARSGVEVNPERCIVWLSETNLAMRHILAHTRFGRGLS